MTPEIIRCPLCDLPHRVGAIKCDGCDQPLDSKPDFDSMRRELVTRRRHVVMAASLIVLMLLLNIFLFGGEGFIVVSAPGAWLVWSWMRARALARRLARAP